MQSITIVGCGYTGLRLGRRWLDSGAKLRGFAAHAQSLAAIEAIGGESRQLDLDAPIERIDVDRQILYYLVPPDRDREGDARLERLLGTLAGSPRRIVYLSTTGVYGERSGAVVDEDTPPAPTSSRAARRLAAEAALRAWADSRGVSWCILRVAGIYGPGRLPLDRLRRKQAAIRLEEATPSNRIHVEDLASACVAAAVAARADRRIYNVADGSDDSLTAYLLRVARISGLPSPPLISRAQALRTLPASSRDFLGESRRVDNRRMLDELGIALAYHDLDAGIRASLAAAARGAQE
jgi:nucleoside-diphosphate-sugar epimerase